MSTQQQRTQELERIRKDNGGILKPPKVVDEARDPSSPLHDWFTWDDSEAGERYRIIEARKLIRVHVTEIPQNKQTVRAYVSLSRDRKAGGGYRQTQEVLDNSALRREMLREAMRDFELFEKKYRHLEELSELFEGADKVREQQSLMQTA